MEALDAIDSIKEAERKQREKAEKKAEKERLRAERSQRRAEKKTAREESKASSDPDSEENESLGTVAENIDHPPFGIAGHRICHHRNQIVRP